MRRDGDDDDDDDELMMYHAVCFYGNCSACRTNTVQKPTVHRTVPGIVMVRYHPNNNKNTLE